jgi:predicted Zn-dependent protease
VSVLTRGAILVVAIVACAWFALGARQAHEITAATAIASSGPQLSASQAAHADSLLAAAGILNPDTQVDLLRAQVALERGDRRHALAIIRRVNTLEPDNALGWLWLERAASNLTTFYVGAYHLLILAPKVH